MALTQSAWSDTTVQGKLVSTCTVAQTAAEKDAYTLKTPTSLNTDEAWTLSLTFSGTPDGTALPVDLWMGYGDDFAISGDHTTVAATSGGEFKTIMDDVVLAVGGLEYVWLMDPDLAVADVVTVAAIATGLKVKIPRAPYYAINLDGAGALLAVTGTWKIIQ
tara:strand:- start:1017 stop:1502 length:486 start_codon:yes stop_codon:yes gene_type:complete